MKRPNVYAEVWAHVYGLAPGEPISLAGCLRVLPLESRTVWRALSQATEARLVQRSGPAAWRAALPDPISIEWAVLNGSRFTIAWNVYDSLRKAGLLKLETTGFVPVRKTTIRA